MVRRSRALTPVATLLALLAPLVVTGSLAAQDDLGDYFGFTGLEVIKIGRNAGPMISADLDGDGLNDLVVVNNHASQLDLLFQKAGASPDDAVRAPSRVNDLPEHWRFRREKVSVAHHISAIIAYDYDHDGLLDLIYAGQPAVITFLRQTEPGVFESARRHRVRHLSANPAAFHLADITGDNQPELLALVDGAINIWPLDGDALGQPQKLAAGGNIVAFVVADYDGNGLLDVAGILPDDPAPVRIWLGRVEDGVSALGPQLRMEMPPLVEFEAVHINGEAAARIAVIERASKRIVLYELRREDVDEKGDREAAFEVTSFTDPENRERQVVVVDIDGDGFDDVVASDSEANTLVVFRQEPGKGLGGGTSWPSLTDIDYMAARATPSGAEIYVLSEKEGVVGRIDTSGDDVPFPRSLQISEGHTPVTLSLVELDGVPTTAVVGRSGREYMVDLIGPDDTLESVELGSMSRAPDTIVALDADQDGRTDLLLFTRDKPMTMLRSGDEGWEVVESRDMGQFGLVKSASADNTALFDIDGDGKEELLIADNNYVRAVRYDSEAGAGGGWEVARQINTADPTSSLVAVTLMGRRIIAADKENDRLVVLAEEDGHWAETESLTVRGFDFGPIHAGSFTGEGDESVLAVGDDGFAVIRFAGERAALHELASWRTDEDRRYQHELAVGDVNSDGYTDLVSLDAGEQMLELFTFSQSGDMLYVTGFQIFESKLFSGGESREYEPNQVIITDMTGDGAHDIVLLVHDRVLIYPQMTGEVLGAAP